MKEGNGPERGSLVGEGWQTTIIDGKGSGTVVYGSSGTTVSGFTIRGSGAGYFDSGIWISNGSVAILDNRIVGNTAGVFAWCFDAATATSG